MRLLILAAETPLPANTGFRLRNLHLARALAAAAVVDFVALGPVPSAHDEAFRLQGVGAQRGRFAALAASVRMPYMQAKLPQAPLAASVRGGAWTSVQAESPFMGPAALTLGRPVVLDAHNVETELPRTLAEADTRAPAALRRARWRWETRKTQTHEQAMVRAAAAVAATSQSEAEVFERWGAREVVVVPNGIDTTAIGHADPAPGALLAYVGTFGYLPNVVAASELLDEVLPRVRARLPEAGAVLIGRDPGPHLLSRRGPGIEVTGTVPDVLPHLRRARVVVVPLRAGGGTRLKVLEAMAAGVPVVSTRFGVSGLEVRDGEHVLLGETPAELADAAVRVCTDDALARSLSDAGRRLACSRYDWSIVARPLVEVHARLAGT